jgi:hypothetical protein
MCKFVVEWLNQNYYVKVSKEMYAQVHD